MKYCDEYAALISAGVDNALTADERKQLMDHLAQCPACREAYTQMMTMHEAFTDWEEELPGDLAGSVMEQIRKEKAVNKKRKRSWLPLVAAAACCALVFVSYQNMNIKQNTAGINASAQTENAKSITAESDSALPVKDSAETEDSAAFDDSVSYTTSADDILLGDSEDQLLDGVLTYFRSAPEETEIETAADEPVSSVKENPQVLTILTSHDTALTEWMEGNTAAEGHTEEGTTAWLITLGEYDALLVYLNENGIVWEQILVETPDSDVSDLVCVVQLPS